jgi:CHAT domain-containing protein/tetratricopeptide (TPR) repeat protein
MISHLILLAQAIFGFAALAQTPVSSAPGQAGVELIRPGQTIRASLPVRIESERNAAWVEFDLEVSSAGAVTISLESLDFDPRLGVSGGPGDGESRDSKSFGYWNARLVSEVAQATHLRVRVESENDQGGEFALSVASGRIENAKDPVERTRSVIADCAALAGHASERGDVPRSLGFLNTASRASYAIGEYSAAEEFAERQLSAAEACGSKDHLVRARVNLGVAVIRRGDTPRAQELIENAMRLAEERLAQATGTPGEGEWAALLCFGYDKLADCQLDAHADQKALPLLRKVVDLAPRSSRPDAVTLAWIKLGTVLDQCGDGSGARAAFEKAIAGAENVKGNPELLATALARSAEHCATSGTPEECRARCERALALPCRPETKAFLLGILTGAYIDLARYEEALATADAFDELCRANRIEAQQIPMHIDRAVIAYRLGDLPRARNLLEEALAMQERSGDLMHRVEILLDLGLVLQEAEEVEEAQLVYEEALATCERSGSRLRQAQVLIDRVRLLDRRRDFSAALAAVDKAGDLAADIGDRSTQACVMNSRAWILYRQNQLDRARDLASSAAREQESRGEAEYALTTHDTLARIALAEGDVLGVEDALCAAEEFFDLRSEVELDRFHAIGRRSRFADWGGIAQDLVALRLKSGSLSPVERAAILGDGWSGAALWKGRVLFERMKKEASAARQGSSASPTQASASMTPEVPPRAAIVEYVDGIEKLYAYVVREDGVHLVDLGPRDPIEKRARQFVTAVTGRRSPPKTISSQGSWLYARLITPLAAWLTADIRSLILIPTPALSTMPFEALVEPSSAANDERPAFDELRYLIDAYDVTYAPSSRVLAELQRRGGDGRTPHFLILADPVYPPEARGGAAQDVLAAVRQEASLADYDRLTSTRDEAAEIARLLIRDDPAATDQQRAFLLQLPEARSASLRTSRFDLRLGSKAGREVFGGDLAPYTTLHVAVHGQVDSRDPRRSGLVLASESGVPGMFTLADVLGLSLDVDLVVLSACDTARGPIVRGEGVQSLACAFLEAGSRSVIASLWRVEDEKAADLMISFYRRHLDRHEPPARALRQAKLDLRRSRSARGSPIGEKDEREQIYVASNPYFWAPFVYIGAPGE